MPLGRAASAVEGPLHRLSRTAPGDAPGTLVSTPGAARPRVSAIAYGPHELAEHVARDLEEIRAMRGKWPVLWVNVDGVDHAGTVQEVGEIFGLHRLALADVMQTEQRAKVNSYDDHLFALARMVRLAPGLDVEQIGLFVGAGFVVTFQQRPGDPLEPVRDRLRAGHPRLRCGGPDYLAYALIDAIVDHYFPVLETYADRLDEMEDAAVDSPSHGDMARLHRTRRELMTLRRAIWPLREALGDLLRDPDPHFSPETLVYLRDCHDHAFQVLDLVETYRELAASLTDLHLSSVSNRMNEVMKVLTIFASIFIPLGFVTGIYGMNVSHPDRAWYWQWPFALGIMAVIALGLLAYFWRRGWIAGDE